MDTLAANRNRAIEHELLAIVEATLRDLRPGAPLPHVTLAASLDRDLAFDSLGRMELLLRVEREFGVDLPEDTLARAETVGALLEAVQAAQARTPAQRRERAAVAARAAQPVEAPAQPGAGVGLRNIRDRLTQTYGEDYRLELRPAHPRGLMVTLDIPFQPASVGVRETS